MLYQLNVAQDRLEKIDRSESVMERLQLYTGLTEKEIYNDLQHKQRILQWMVNNNVDHVDQIGMLMAKYYLGTLALK